MDLVLPSPPPPLPQDRLILVLSSLLPPLPHLIDPALLAPALLQRLQYLPPSAAEPEPDADAYLSPFPAAPGQPLSGALSRLEKDGCAQGPVQYTHDGEVYMARVELVPADVRVGGTGAASTNEGGGGGGGGAPEGSVEVWFSYEKPSPPLSFSAAGSTAPVLQWLYHSTRLPIPVPAPSSSTSPTSTPLKFYASPRLVPLDLGTPPLYAEPDSLLPTAGQAPEHYWNGFTPPTPSIRLPDDPLQGEGGDDAYWAQYSRGPSTQTSRRTSYNGADGTGSAGVYDRPAGDRRISGGFPLLDTKLRGLNMSRAAGSDDVTPTATKPGSDLPLRNENQQGHGRASPGEQLLLQKMEATISTVLKRAWTEHSRAAAHSGRDEDFELAGMEWLRLGREVLDTADIHKSQANGGPGGQASAPSSDGAGATKAKIEVCREMWGAIRSQGTEDDGFWRLIEESIRMPRGGFGTQREEQGWEPS